MRYIAGPTTVHVVQLALPTKTGCSCCLDIMFIGYQPDKHICASLITKPFISLEIINKFIYLFMISLSSLRMW